MSYQGEQGQQSEVADKGKGKAPEQQQDAGMEDEDSSDESGEEEV